MKVPQLALLALWITCATTIQVKPQPSRNTRPRNLLPLLNKTTNLQTPPGYSVIIDLSTTKSFPPEKILLAGIVLLYDLATQGYLAIIKAGSPRFTFEVEGISLSFRTLALKPPHPQCEIRYLIFGLLSLVDKMTKTQNFCAGIASVFAFREPVGFVRMDAPKRPGSSNDKALRHNETSNIIHDIVRSTTGGLGERVKVVDPYDPNFAISYELFRDPMSCVDMLSGVLYAIATAAQGDNKPCQDLAGFNEQRTAVYMIYGRRKTESGNMLNYENVRRGLVLLAARMYGDPEGFVCGEVEFSFEFKEEVLGGGRIVLNDFPGAVAR